MLMQYINEQLTSNNRPTKLKSKAKLSQSLSTETIYNSIYHKLTSHSHKNIKSVENKFIPQIIKAQSAVKQLVNRISEYQYNNYKDKSILKSKEMNIMGSLSPRKSLILNETLIPNQQLPIKNNKCRLLAPNYHSALNNFIINTNAITNDNVNKHSNKKPKSIFPKLFPTIIDTINDKNTFKVTKDSYQKTNAATININTNNSDINNNNLKRNNNLLKKNYVVKLIFKKCLEFINQNNKTKQFLNLNNDEDNQNKNDSINKVNSAKINKYNIYNQISNDTITLLPDETKWKPLDKKIEAAMDITSKYTINLAMNNFKSLKKELKEQENSGGYLFVNEDSIHNDNIYTNKLKAIKQKKLTIHNKHKSITDVVMDSSMRVDLLMKKLESYNKKNMKIKINEQQEEGRYFKVSSYFSYNNNWKNKKNVKSFINQSL